MSLAPSSGGLEVGGAIGHLGAAEAAAVQRAPPMTEEETEDVIASIAHLAEVDPVVAGLLTNPNSSDLETLLRQEDASMKATVNDYVVAQYAEADRYLTILNEMSACEAKLASIEKNIGEFLEELSTTADAVMMMQSQTTSLLHNVNNRKKTRMELVKVYDAVNGCGAFCQAITSREVDSKFLVEIGNYEAKLDTWYALREHKGNNLADSALDREIQPQLELAAARAGDKIQKYLLKRFQSLAEPGTNVLLHQQILESTCQHAFRFLWRYNNGIAVPLLRAYVNIIREVHSRTIAAAVAELRQVTYFLPFEPAAPPELLNAIFSLSERAKQELEETMAPLLSASWETNLSQDSAAVGKTMQGIRRIARDLGTSRFYSRDDDCSCLNDAGLGGAGCSVRSNANSPSPMPPAGSPGQGGVQHVFTVSPVSFHRAADAKEGRQPDDNGLLAPGRSGGKHGQPVVSAMASYLKKSLARAASKSGLSRQLQQVGLPTPSPISLLNITYHTKDTDAPLAAVTAAGASSKVLTPFSRLNPPQSDTLEAALFEHHIDTLRAIHVLEPHPEELEEPPESVIAATPSGAEAGRPGKKNEPSSVTFVKGAQSVPNATVAQPVAQKAANSTAAATDQSRGVPPFYTGSVMIDPRLMMRLSHTDSWPLRFLYLITVFLNTFVAERQFVRHFFLYRSQDSSSTDQREFSILSDVFSTMHTELTGIIKQLLLCVTDSLTLLVCLRILEICKNFIFRGASSSSVLLLSAFFGDVKHKGRQMLGMLMKREKIALECVESARVRPLEAGLLEAATGQKLVLGRTSKGGAGAAGVRLFDVAVVAGSPAWRKLVGAHSLIKSVARQASKLHSINTLPLRGSYINGDGRGSHDGDGANALVHFDDIVAEELSGMAQSINRCIVRLGKERLGCLAVPRGSSAGRPRDLLSLLASVPEEDVLASLGFICDHEKSSGDGDLVLTCLPSLPLLVFLINNYHHYIYRWVAAASAARRRPHPYFYPSASDLLDDELLFFANDTRSIPSPSCPVVGVRPSTATVNNSSFGQGAKQKSGLPSRLTSRTTSDENLQNRDIIISPLTATSPAPAGGPSADGPDGANEARSPTSATETVAEETAHNEVIVSDLFAYFTNEIVAEYATFSNDKATGSGRDSPRGGLTPSDRLQMLLNNTAFLCDGRSATALRTISLNHTNARDFARRGRPLPAAGHRSYFTSAISIPHLSAPLLLIDNRLDIVIRLFILLDMASPKGSGLELFGELLMLAQIDWPQLFGLLSFNNKLIELSARLKDNDRVVKMGQSEGNDVKAECEAIERALPGLLDSLRIDVDSLSRGKDQNDKVGASPLRGISISHLTSLLDRFHQLTQDNFLKNLLVRIRNIFGASPTDGDASKNDEKSSRHSAENVVLVGRIFIHYIIIITIGFHILNSATNLFLKDCKDEDTIMQLSSKMVGRAAFCIDIDKALATLNDSS